MLVFYLGPSSEALNPKTTIPKPQTLNPHPRSNRFLVQGPGMGFNGFQLGLFGTAVGSLPDLRSIQMKRICFGVGDFFIVGIEARQVVHAGLALLDKEGAYSSRPEEVATSIFAVQARV